MSAPDLLLETLQAIRACCGLESGLTRDRLLAQLSDVLPHHEISNGAELSVKLPSERFEIVRSKEEAIRADLCAPPREVEDASFHWLISERATGPSVGAWLDGTWYLVNEPGPVTPETLRMRGWRWYAVIQIPQEIDGQ